MILCSLRGGCVRATGNGCWRLSGAESQRCGADGKQAPDLPLGNPATTALYWELSYMPRAIHIAAPLGAA